MRRLAAETGRMVVYNSLSQTMRRPDEWKVHMARAEETAAMMAELSAFYVQYKDLLTPQ